MNSVQKTRLAKAVRELQDSTGWQDIKRFILAESGADEPQMDELIAFITELLQSALLRERQWAEGKRA